eukprot:gene561-17619_t
MSDVSRCLFRGNVPLLIVFASFMVQSVNAAVIVDGYSPQALATTGDTIITITGSGFLSSVNPGCKITWGVGQQTSFDPFSSTDTEVKCEWKEADSKQNFNDISTLSGTLEINIFYTSDNEADVAVDPTKQAFMYLKSDYNSALSVEAADESNFGWASNYGPIDDTTKVKVQLADNGALPNSADAKCLVTQASSSALTGATYAATCNPNPSPNDDTCSYYMCEFTKFTEDLDDASAEEAFQYQLSLSSNDAEIVGSNELDFNYVMPGPEISNVVPIRGGTTLTVTWDYPVTTDDSGSLPSDCAGIFTSATVAILGTGATCTWPNAQNIEINLGTISVFSFTLDVKVNTFYRTLKSLSSLIIHADTDDDVDLVTLGSDSTTTIIGPQTLTFCTADGNYLDGFTANDVVFRPRVQGTSGPNDLTFAWSMTPSVGAGSVDFSGTVTADDVMNEKSALLGSSSYTLRVDVSGAFTALSATMDIEVKVDTDGPSGYFESGRTMMIARSEDVNLRAAITSHGCTPDVSGSRTYTVTLEETSSGNLILDVDGLELTIGRNTLNVGTLYTAKLKESGDVIATTDITVNAADLVAEIIGGPKRLLGISSNTPPTLYAAANDADADATYEWTCTSGSCGEVTGVTADNVMPGSTNDVEMQFTRVLVTGTYEITLTVTDSSQRTAVTTTTLVVDSDPDILLSVQGAMVGLHLQKAVQAGSDVVINAAVAASVSQISAGTTFSWSTAADDRTSAALDLALASDTVSSARSIDDRADAFVETLVLNGDALEPGGRYLLRATLASSSKDVAWAELTVDVPYPPGNMKDLSDRVSVLPSTGTACVTSFTLSAHGFVSEDLMTFEYAMKSGSFNNGEPIIVQTSHGSVNPKGIFLPIGITQVGVRASDKNGFTAWSWTDVTVTSPSFGELDDVLASLPSFGNAEGAALLGSEYQQLAAITMHLSAGGTADQQNQALDVLLDAASRIGSLNATPFRRTKVMMGVSALKLYADSWAERDLKITEKIGDVLNTLVGTFEAGLTTTVDVEYALAALKGVATESQIDAILSTDDDTRLLNIASILKGVLAPLCGAVEYGQPDYSFDDAFVQIKMARSPAATVATTNGASMIVPADVQDAVKRSSDCAEDLAVGSASSTTSCIGGCVILEEVAGNVQGLLDSSGATSPISAQILSPAVSVWVQATDTGRRRRRSTATASVTMSISSQDCSDGTMSCECREWDSVNSVWTDSGSFPGNSGGCDLSVNVGLSDGEASLQSVAAFSSCGAGFLGRGCYSDCPAGYWGVGCVQEQDCNGMTLNQVDGRCACNSGWTGTSCNELCNSSEAILKATALSSDTMQQGFGVNCGNKCTCYTAGTASCNIESGACICKDGFEGANCDVNIDDCTLPDGEPACKNDGICFDRIAGFTCNCLSTGFSGDTCEGPVDYCSAAVGECLNEASCVDSVQNLNFTCACPIGFVGTYCESYCDDGWWGPDCAEECTCVNGVCHAVTGECACDEGYVGEDCDAVPEVKNIVPLAVGVTVGVVAFIILIVLIWWYCEKRSARKQHHSSNLAGLSASRFEAATRSPFSASNKPVLADPNGPVGIVIEKVENGKIKIKMITPYLSLTTVNQDTTLALLRDTLCSLAPHQFGAGDESKFYFEKIDGSGSYVSTHEMTLFAQKCYPDNLINVRFTPYTEEARLEFCICGRVSVFECSMCSKAGYCSEKCQRGDWKLHRVGCRAQSAKEEAKTDELAAKLSNGAAVAGTRAAASASAPNEAGAAATEGGSAAVIRADPSLPELDTCAVCGTSSQFECSSCGMVGYCSKKCQRSDWPTHKILCKAAKKASITNANLIDKDGDGTVNRVAQATVNNAAGKTEAADNANDAAQGEEAAGDVSELVAPSEAASTQEVAKKASITNANLIDKDGDGTVNRVAQATVNNAAGKTEAADNANDAAQGEEAAGDVLELVAPSEAASTQEVAVPEALVSAPAPASDGWDDDDDPFGVKANAALAAEADAAGASA